MAKKTTKSPKKKSVKKAAASFDSSALYRHHEDVLYRAPSPEEITVIRTDDMDYFYKIDSWAARLWLLLDGKTTLRQACEIIQKASGLEADFVEQNIATVIKELVAENLIDKNV